MNLEEKLLISLSSISIAIIVVYAFYDYRKKRGLNFNSLNIENEETPKRENKKIKISIKNIKKQASLSLPN